MADPVAEPNTHEAEASTSSNPLDSREDDTTTKGGSREPMLDSSKKPRRHETLPILFLQKRPGSEMSVTS